MALRKFGVGIPQISIAISQPGVFLLFVQDMKGKEMYKRSLIQDFVAKAEQTFSRILRRIYDALLQLGQVEADTQSLAILNALIQIRLKQKYSQICKFMILSPIQSHKKLTKLIVNPKYSMITSKKFFIDNTELDNFIFIIEVHPFNESIIFTADHDGKVQLFHLYYNTNAFLLPFAIAYYLGH